MWVTRAAHLALLGVNGQLGLDVLDVEESDALGLPGSARLGERPALAGRLGRTQVAGPCAQADRAQQAIAASVDQDPKASESAWTWCFLMVSNDLEQCAVVLSRTGSRSYPLDASVYSSRRR